MSDSGESGTYSYNDHASHPDPPHQGMFLRPMAARIREFLPGATSFLDAGCGDGNFTESFSETSGLQAYGIDGSASGVRIANERGCGKFSVGSLYDSLSSPFGVESYSVVISVEVIEHLYDPRAFIERCEEVVEPGGLLILTTPYWGYLKNIALAVTNRMDRSLTPLWDGGHIKHWSRSTLTRLVTEKDFELLSFDGSDGRRPPFLWNGMMLTFRRR